MRARGRKASVGGRRRDVGAGRVAPCAEVQRLSEQDAAADALSRQNVPSSRERKERHRIVRQKATV